MTPTPTACVARTRDFAERVRASFARQAAMRLIGAGIVDVRPGYCAVGLEVRPELGQQHGYLHAGIVGAGVDTPAATRATRCFRRRPRC